jgi:hypothetical protein
MSEIVSNAILNLKDLEKSMRLEILNFSSDDVENCDKLAEALQQLENEVKNLHEELETETIKSSMYRHKLSFFNNDLSKEISENIKLARDSNIEVIMSLKQKLNELTKSIQNLLKKDKQLTDEISIMKPEKKSLEIKHENIIKSLNDYMAQKAAVQIKLNETRDNLRETNSVTLELEDDMLVLKETLVNEKLIARKEKNILEDETQITSLEVIKQEELNEHKGREVEENQKKLDHTEKSLRTIYRENERLENLAIDVTKEINSGNKELEEERKKLEASHIKSLSLATLEAATQQNYYQTKGDTINKTKEAGERSHIETENLKKLKEIQDIKREELRKVYESYKELVAILETLKKAIFAMKAEIGAKLQEIAEIESKNQRIYRELSEAQETHNQVMDSLQREAEECREQLVFERDLKMKTQSLRDAKLMEIETFNANSMAHQSMANKYFAEIKTKNEELAKRDKINSEIIEINKKEKSRLLAELDLAIAKFKKMKETLESQVSHLTKEIDFYTKEIEKYSKEINALTPDYKNLCSSYKEITKDYEETRKALILCKTKKSNLESLIAQTKQKILDHENSRERIKQILAIKRQDTISKLSSNAEELKNLENEILEIGLKTQTINTENKKFIQEIRAFEGDYSSIDLFILNNQDSERILEIEYNRIHDQLKEGWKTDVELEKYFETEDLQLITKIQTLLQRTLTRENNVLNLTKSFSRELNDFDYYLKEMANIKSTEKDPEE